MSRALFLVLFLAFVWVGCQPGSPSGESAGENAQVRDGGDGGAAGKLGDPCTCEGLCIGQDRGSCEAPWVCVKSVGQGTCTQRCGDDQPACPAGSRCASGEVDGQKQGWCVRN